MAEVILTQLATTYLAPQIYGVIATGAEVASAGALWTISKGLAGAIGSTVGAFIDRKLFSNESSIIGPRLSDLTVMSSADGAGLPIIYGTVRVAGNVIWSTGLEEVVSKSDSGGGSGGGGGSSTSYSYKTDVAVAICEGTMTGIRKIWADSKLVYDISGTAKTGSLLASIEQAAAVRVYPGTETQEVDPLIESIEGVDSTPAYKGISYIVIEDLQLADFGNRLPNLSFEVVRNGNILENLERDVIEIETTLCQYSSSHIPRSLCIKDGMVYVTVIDNVCDDVNRLRIKFYVLPPDLSKATLYKEEYVENEPHIIPGYTSYSTVAYQGYLTEEPGIVFAQYDGWDGSYGPFYYYGYINGKYYTKLYVAIHSIEQDDLANTASMSKIGSKLIYINSQNAIPITNTFYPAIVIKDILQSTTKYIPLPAIIGHTNRSLNIVATKDYIYLVKYDDYNSMFFKFDYDGNILAEKSGITGIGGYIGSGNMILPYDGNNKIILTDFYIFDFATLTKGTTKFIGGNLNLHTGYLATSNRLSDKAAVIYSLDERNNIGDIGFRVKSFVGGMGSSTIKLDEVASDILERGLDNSQIDVSILSSDNLRGYAISRPMSIKEAITPLLTTYSFELKEEDGKLKAYKNAGNTNVETINSKLVGVSEI